jgi:hypothetical protein
MHVQAEEQDRAGGGGFRSAPLNGGGHRGRRLGAGRASHHRWLGTAHAVQPTFVSESRHRFHFHRQPYCV